MANGTTEMVMNITDMLNSLVNTTTTAAKPPPAFNPLSQCNFFLMQFITMGVLHWFNVVFGFFGNLLIIVIMFMDKSTRWAVKISILALAVVDILVVASSVIQYSLTATLNMERAKHIKTLILLTAHIHVWQFPLIIMVRTLSIYTVTSMAITRFFRVCVRSAARLCSFPGVVIQLVVLYVVGIALHMPDFWEYSWFEFRGLPFPMAHPTLTKDEAYRTYKLIARPIVTVLIPMLVLIGCNVALIVALRRSKRLRTQLSNGAATNGGLGADDNHKTTGLWKAEEDSITVMMIVIIFVFILCYLPETIFRICDYIWPPDFKGMHPCGFYRIAGQLALWLVHFNSAINFLLYSLSRQKFRRIARRLLCPCCPGPQEGQEPFSNETEFNTELPSINMNGQQI